MIDAKDLEILLYIQAKPLATLSHIAQHIGMSVSNISTRLNRLETEQKLFNGVQIDLQNDALELDLFDFFFHVKDSKSLVLLEKKFGHYHPYLRYRARCNGHKNGLYLQFRAPKEGLNYIEELSSILVDKGVLENYQYIKRAPNFEPIKVSSSLRSWNPEKKTWEFDWARWRENINDSSSTKTPNVEPVKSILAELTELDVKLLAELTLDARSKNVDVIKKIGLQLEPGTAQKVSRRIRYLKEKAIKNYRINLQWSQFFLYQSIIVRGYNGNGNANKIYNYIKDCDEEDIRFPFRCNYFLADDGFFWYVRAPPAHLSEFTNFIWDICPDFELYTLDYKNSQVYGFWDQTFDAERKAWKVSYEFMIDKVLNKMFK
ncbi:MAG: winged helix-turn-helix transcriptional regulator [Candidatus Heimdallarchaeota archaeon]